MGVRLQTRSERPTAAVSAPVAAPGSATHTDLARGTAAGASRDVFRQAQADPARGWRILGELQPDGQRAPLPDVLRCDVAIVGTGAGGGITAELLSKAGLDVVMIEEGPLRTSRDFTQYEGDAYPALYQESAARKTRDKAINILQGRCVGGSTTVNWTGSFRTPDNTLAFWAERFGLQDLQPADLSPWFMQAERRLGVEAWLAAPNENNDLLRRGAAQLGYSSAAILRNVRQCWNLGSCGMGCPTNAKQSMLVTTIPQALDLGARLVVGTRVERLLWRDRQVQGLVCVPVSLAGDVQGPSTLIEARHVVVAGGAINSPALLLRSRVPDPHGLLGARTFVHPVVVSAADFEQPVEGWYGAPQTIYSDHFLDQFPIDGPIGFKLEAPPLHPVIFATTMTGFGAEQAALLRRFAHTHVQLALMRDGFHRASPGGRVSLRADGSPELDYPLTEFIMDGARRALLAMAEIQFAAGARHVLPIHEHAQPMPSWQQAQRAIAGLPMQPLLTRVVSAHVMGGCGMAGNQHLGVTRPDGLHWQLDNLSIHDGSLFPTSIGANPQTSVYGIVNRLATQLAPRLGGLTPSLI